MRIALDAFGGDHAPGPNIEGALSAVAENPELHISLVGHEDEMRAALDQHEYTGDQITIVDCEGTVEMDETPTKALRAKPNCSIAVTWKLMAEKKVDAVVSAGNTGAVVAAGLRTRLFLKGVKRPGIAVTLPTAKGPAILMDAGANPDAKAEHLVQYALMGQIYARDVLGIESPKVGLLNIGSEEGKGTPLCRETHAGIKASAWAEHYVGNIEGRDLFVGDVPVIVCEGFVGNVLLKASEGFADFLLGAAGKAILGALDQERDQAKQALGKFARGFQYQESGGAPLLGIDGICMICHGSSDARSIRNALGAATKIHERGVNEKIAAHL